MKKGKGKKIGRNKPCPCGSGKKYKKCCYLIQSSSFLKTLEEEIKRRNAEFSAQEFQRKKQQGLGKPIISTKFGTKQAVAVGNIVNIGSWKTFFDFLSDYIKRLFTATWGNNELSKSFEQRHPLLKIYNEVCQQLKSATKNANGVYSGDMTGAFSFYYGLANNLFLIQHNEGLQKKLLERLKKKDQFSSAYYETYVAAMFIKAGFKIDFENEDSRKRSHPEFIATHKISGKKYTVEAKQRQIQNIISEVGSSSIELDYDALGDLLKKALKKYSSHERIIFIDINLPSEVARKYSQYQLVNFIKTKEKQFKEMPSAYVLLTNHPYHYELDRSAHYIFILAEGFHISDFGLKRITNLHDAIIARKKHAPIHALCDAIEKHEEVPIPTTFDGSIPEFTFGDTTQRLKIGSVYQIPDQAGEIITGTLVDCTVNEKEKKAYGLCQTNKGILLISFELTQSELNAYHKHPETFFGVYKDPVKKAETPKDLYDFFYSSYSDLKKKELISRLISHFDTKFLQKKSNEELLTIYCEGLVIASEQQRRKGRFLQKSNEGVLINDASSEKIDKAYLPIITDIKQITINLLNNACHSIYLTGSIPRGMGTLGESDINCIVILNPGHTKDVFLKKLQGKFHGLTKQYSQFELISRIAIELWNFNDIFPLAHSINEVKPCKTLSIYHSILKISSICIEGENIIPLLSPIYPNLALANTAIIQLEDDIKEAIQYIKQDDVVYYCKYIMKKIIRITFCFLIPLIGEYTRDIDLCAEKIIQHYPNMTGYIKQANTWIHNPINESQQILDFLNKFSQLLLLEVNRWMYYHNPERQKELLINSELDKSNLYYLPENKEV